MDFLAKYIGIPYAHKGRTMKGLDCWGLVKLIYKDLGYVVKDIEDYEMEGHLKGHDYFQPKDDWTRNSIYQQYDVALFLNTQGVAYHAGVVTPDHRLIHASKQAGVVIQNLNVVTRAIKLDGYYHLKARDAED
jgi:cell wall-associated NlpC family hydrolase